MATSNIIKVKTPRKVAVVVAIESGERLRRESYSEACKRAICHRNRVFLFRSSTTTNPHPPTQPKPSAPEAKMANQATAASRLPKPSKNQDERVSIASAPRSSSGSSKLPVRSNRATGVITGLRRPASKSTSSDITAISSQVSLTAIPSSFRSQWLDYMLTGLRQTKASRKLCHLHQPLTSTKGQFQRVEPFSTPPSQ